MVEELSSIKAGILPDRMAEGSALALYDLFNVPQETDANVFNPFALPKQFRKAMKQDGSKYPAKLMKTSMKLMGKLYGMKDFDHYFEI